MHELDYMDIDEGIRILYGNIFKGQLQRSVRSNGRDYDFLLSIAAIFKPGTSSSIEERDTRIVDDLLCLPVAKGTKIYQQKKKK